MRHNTNFYKSMRRALMQAGYRYCNMCVQWWCADCFSPRSLYRCRSCARDYAAKAYRKYPSVRAGAKLWRAANRKKVLAYQKRWRDKQKSSSRRLTPPIINPSKT